MSLVTCFPKDDLFETFLVPYYEYQTLDHIKQLERCIRNDNLQCLETNAEPIIYESRIFTASPAFKLLIRQCYIEGKIGLAETLIRNSVRIFVEMDDSISISSFEPVMMAIFGSGIDDEYSGRVKISAAQFWIPPVVAASIEAGGDWNRVQSLLHNLIKHSSSSLPSPILTIFEAGECSIPIDWLFRKIEKCGGRLHALLQTRLADLGWKEANSIYSVYLHLEKADARHIVKTFLSSLQMSLNLLTGVLRPREFYILLFFMETLSQISDKDFYLIYMKVIEACRTDLFEELIEQRGVTFVRKVLANSENLVKYVIKGTCYANIDILDRLDLTQKFQDYLASDFELPHLRSLNNRFDLESSLLKQNGILSYHVIDLVLLCMANSDFIYLTLCLSFIYEIPVLLEFSLVNFPSIMKSDAKINNPSFHICYLFSLDTESFISQYSSNNRNTLINDNLLNDSLLNDTMINYTLINNLVFSARLTKLLRHKASIQEFMPFMATNLTLFASTLDEWLICKDHAEDFTPTLDTFMGLVPFLATQENSILFKYQTSLLWRSLYRSNSVLCAFNLVKAATSWDNDLRHKFMAYLETKIQAFSHPNLKKSSVIVIIRWYLSNRKPHLKTYRRLAMSILPLLYGTYDSYLYLDLMKEARTIHTELLIYSPLPLLSYILMSLGCRNHRVPLFHSNPQIRSNSINEFIIRCGNDIDRISMIVSYARYLDSELLQVARDRLSTLVKNESSSLFLAQPKFHKLQIHLEAYYSTVRHFYQDREMQEFRIFKTKSNDIRRYVFLFLRLNRWSTKMQDPFFIPSIDLFSAKVGYDVSLEIAAAYHSLSTHEVLLLEKASLKCQDYRKSRAFATTPLLCYLKALFETISEICTRKRPACFGLPMRRSDAMRAFNSQ